MKKIIISLLCLLLYSSGFSQDNAGFNGKTVKNINIKTSRIDSETVRKKFLMREGDVFFEENYDEARQALHDMRVFKSIDFNIAGNDDDTVDIDIDAKDGFYIFPMIFGTSGKKSTFAAALIEANLFKAGETVILFGAGNSDGFSTMAGFGIRNDFISFGLSDMEFTEYEYKNGSYNTSGLFTSEPDKGRLGQPIKKYKVTDNSLGVSWSRSFYEKAGFTLGFRTSDIDYSGNDMPDDKGKHNRLSAGIRSYKNMRPGGGGAGFGSIFGIGLSDIADKLAGLPKEKFGYFAGLTYESGGDHTGSDFGISKASLKLSGNVEFKSRNVFFMDIAAAKDFESSFYDKIKSKDVLSGKGIYSSEFRGDEAIGAGMSFVWRPVKNKTGVLSVVPFIENAVLWNKNGPPQNQGGAGIIVSYHLWRIPFPIGLNYTQNLNDGSSDVSFLFGGGF
ncbi:MAG: hypothetical protein FWH43_00665 [Endomicrobia bacterium]|nr:hypothetical protein [Endomicrobiia bacterium]